MLKKSIFFFLILLSCYSATIYGMDLFLGRKLDAYDSENDDSREIPLTVSTTFAESLDSSAARVPPQPLAAALTPTDQAEVTKSDNSFGCPIEGCHVSIDKRKKRFNAIQHMVRHFHPSLEKSTGYSFTHCYECSCGQPLATYTRFYEHRFSCKHGESSKIFFNRKAEEAACELLKIPALMRCPVATCRQIFKDNVTSAHIKQHLRMHPDAPEEKSSVPSVTEKSVKRKAPVIEPKHPSHKKPKITPLYACSKCGEEFKRRNSKHAMKHLENNNDKNEALYGCNECDSQFFTSYEAYTHRSLTAHTTTAKEAHLSRARELIKDMHNPSTAEL